VKKKCNNSTLKKQNTTNADKLSTQKKKDVQNYFEENIQLKIELDNLNRELAQAISQLQDHPPVSREKPNIESETNQEEKHQKICMLAEHMGTEDFRNKVQERAYFIFKITGSTDENSNYFQALEQERASRCVCGKLRAK